MEWGMAICDTPCATRLSLRDTPLQRRSMERLYNISAWLSAAPIRPDYAAIPAGYAAIIRR